MKINLKNIVASQLPEFIRDEFDYQNFVLFLEAYYDFLNLNDKRNIEDIHDIDESFEEFKLYFKREFGLENINYIGNEQLLYKRIRDLYDSKGSESSYKLLFRILFGKPVEIIYPNQFILRPSDGKWIQDISFFVAVNSGDPFNLVGKEININGQNRTVQVFVEKVQLVYKKSDLESLTEENTLLLEDNNNILLENESKISLDLNINQKYDYDIYEIFINKDYFGTIQVGDIISELGFDGYIIPTTTRIKIEQGGAKFKVGQVFDIATDTGSGTKIKITRVDLNGKVIAAQIIKHGIGYETEFVTDISNEIILLNDNSNSTPTSVTTQDFIEKFIDSGYVNEQDYYNFDFADGTYVGDIVSTFYNDSSISGNPDSCAIRVFIGAIARHPGYFATNEGFLDDSIYLQDSKYYQTYSYVLRIDETLDKYKDAVKSTIHPAGMAMFGEYLIENTFDLSLSLQSLIGVLRLRFVDSFEVTDESTVLLFASKVLSDTFNLTDVATKQFSTSFSDNFNLTDLATKQFTKAVTDNVTLTEAINNIDIDKVLFDNQPIIDEAILSYETAFEDEINHIEETLLTIFKPFEETQEIDDLGGYTWYNPYADIYPGYYAEEYTEGTQNF